MTPDSILYFRAGADPSGKDRDVMKAVEKARAAVWSLSDLGMTGATTPEIGCRSWEKEGSTTTVLHSRHFRAWKVPSYIRCLYIYIMLYIYIILYFIILYYIKLYYTVLHYIILCNVILYYIILNYIILYYIILYYVMLYYIILY